MKKTDNNFEIRQWQQAQEDQIDFQEILEILIRNKFTIAIIAILITLGGGVVAYKNSQDSKSAQAIIQFDNKGMEEGKNPDGTIFSKNTLFTVPVANKIYEEYNMSDDFDSFYKQIRINGIVPNQSTSLAEAQLRQGKDYQFNPTRFMVDLKLSDAKLSAQVLSDMLQESIEEYKKNYTPRHTIPKLELGKEVGEEYDYSDYVALFRTTLNNIQTNATEQNKDRFVSSSLGYSYNDIVSRAKNISSIEVSGYSAYINVYRLTKNAIIAENLYKDRIKNLELERIKTIDSAKVIKDVIANYRPAEKQIILASGDSGIKLNNIDDYYSGLVRNYMSTSLRVAEIDSDIRIFKDKLQDLKLPTKEQEEHLARETAKIEREINRVVEDLNKLNENFYSRNYSDLIKIISPVSITSGSKAILIFLVSIILGLFLGIFFAFAKEYIIEYKSRGKKN